MPKKSRRLALQHSKGRDSPTIWPRKQTTSDWVVGWTRWRSSRWHQMWTSHHCRTALMITSSIWTDEPYLAWLEFKMTSTTGTTCQRLQKVSKEKTWIHQQHVTRTCKVANLTTMHHSQASAKPIISMAAVSKSSLKLKWEETGSMATEWTPTRFKIQVRWKMKTMTV